MLRSLFAALAVATAVLTSLSYAAPARNPAGRPTASDGPVRIQTIRNPGYALNPSGGFYDYLDGFGTYLPENDDIRRTIEKARCRHVDKMVIAYVVRMVDGKPVKVIKGVAF
jgi:hypothetical protein